MISSYHVMDVFRVYYRDDGNREGLVNLPRTGYGMCPMLSMHSSGDIIVLDKTSLYSLRPEASNGRLQSPSVLSHRPSPLLYQTISSTEKDAMTTPKE